MRLSQLFFKNETLVTFKPGQAIFREGDAGDSMFVLFEGVADVIVGDNLIGSFEPVEIFGEMAVIDAGPRSATVIANSHCKLASVSQKRFMLLLSQPEFGLHIMKMFIERIRWMNETARKLAIRDGERISELERSIQQHRHINQEQAGEISRLQNQFGISSCTELEPALAG